MSLFPTLQALKTDDVTVTDDAVITPRPAGRGKTPDESTGARKTTEPVNVTRTVVIP